MVFWAHPETKYYENIGHEEGNPVISALLKATLEGGLSVETDPYHSLLNETFDYTGFASEFDPGCNQGCESIHSEPNSYEEYREKSHGPSK